jgi:hypothetical protein
MYYLFVSTEPHLIKVASTAPSETTKADEIAIETAKTGKVTVVVTVMIIFSENRCKSRSANRGNEKPSRHKMENADFPEENSRGLRNLSQKLRKAGYR